MGVQITFRVTDAMAETLAEVQKERMQNNMTETVRNILSDWLIEYRGKKYGSEIGVPND